MRSPIGILSLAGLALLAGCKGSSETYLVVHIQRGTVTADIDKIDLTLDLGTQEASRTIQENGGLLTLPTSVVFQIMHGDGRLTVVGKASRNGAEVATGSAQGDISRGSTTNVTLELGKIQVLDGGVDAPKTDGGGGDVPGTDGGQQDVPPQAAKLVADQPNVAFGSIEVNQSSDIQSVTISNQGQQASSTLSITVDPAAFILQAAAAGDCSASTTLAPNASCTVRLKMTPATPGPQQGTLTVKAAAGGTVTVGLSGTGTSPGSLTASTKLLDFGTTLLNTPVTKTLTITNGGQGAVNGLQVQLGTGTQFTRVTGAATDCGTSVAGGGTCDVRITFTATVRGTSTGSVTISSTNGGTLGATLSGVAQAPASLTASATTLALGDAEVGQTTPAQSWVITNSGDQATAAAPTFTNSNATEFTTTNGCTAALAAGATCTVTVKLTPSAGGSRTATLTMTSGTSSVSAAASGRGLYRLTMTKVVGGAACAGCTVMSNDTPATLACDGTCTGASALYLPGTIVTLQARSTNGSGHWFSGWGGSTSTTCSGPTRDCKLTISASTTVSATFSAMTANLIFHSSATYQTNLGSAKTYDASCNTLATAAGINNTTNNGYVAWMSDANSLATSRITAGGYLRMDGRAFAVSKTELITNRAVLNPAAFDETGVNRNTDVMTGTYEDGSLSTTQTCQNWTSAVVGDQVLGGQTLGGPGNWTAEWGGSCGNPSRILCMGVTSAATVTPSTFTGKRMWLTATTYTPGTDPDAFCTTNKPSNVYAAKAFIAHVGSTAGSLLDPYTAYIRLDGQRIGTGAAIAAGTLDTGIWQTNAATTPYMPVGYSRVWTGASSPTTAGAAAGTCSNWAVSDASTAWFGISATASSGMFFAWNLQACNTTGYAMAQLYCYEP